MHERNGKVRWGVIGAGGIADKRTIPGLRKARNAELAAVMDVDPERVEAIRVRHDAGRGYSSAEELLADPELDAVYIASPVHYHREQALLAARAGKHILLEKPIARTVSEGLEIIRACRGAGVIAAAGFMMRFHSGHQAMKDAVCGGRLGSVLFGRAQMFMRYPDQPGNWRQQKNLSGGGSLMDVGVHCIDLLQYITGGRAVRVSAFTATKVFSYDVDDTATVIFETDRGATCVVEASFAVPGKASRSRLELYGTEGSMLAEHTLGQVEGGNIEAALPAERRPGGAQEADELSFKPVKFEAGDLYTKETESFGASILAGAKPAVPLEDGIQVQKVVEAAYAASQSGRCISL